MFLPAAGPLLLYASMRGLNQLPPPEASRLPSPADVKRAVSAVNFTRIAAPGRPGRPSACGLGLAGYRRDQSREPTGRRDADDVRVLRVPCRRRVRWGAARRGGSHMAISMQGVAPRPRLASKRLERAAMRGRADRASASMPPRCAPSPSPGGQFFCHGSARSGGRHDPKPKKKRGPPASATTAPGQPAGASAAGRSRTVCEAQKSGGRKGPAAQRRASRSRATGSARCA